MPCFKGLAVSIHTPDGPIGEHGIQKQSRASRISTYIPVPPAKVPPGSQTGKPEQSTFAISITLLTPGLNVPYSTPKSTPEDPYPRPRVVGGLPTPAAERGKYSAPVPPYIPRTQNPNETIAAYIYFDGRAKEEVATLLRRGEETWVNSRWVSVPNSEGGGLAEREFLFREVGLERWLNGLDLEGSKNKADIIERRQRKLEKKRRKRKEQQEINSDGEMEDAGRSKPLNRNGVLRYGGENGSPLEEEGHGFFSSASDDSDDDEPPQPEAAGQIKVALFRVLASGEIKRGEYSPQFDAHDDDDEMNQNSKSDEGGDGDVDHTTSFAKPKTLDPKSISTQTVTGIDPPEAPYAVFTFFYRGEKQLKKMGVMPTPETEKTPVISKKRQSGPDFSKLGPLKSTGTVGFSGYRDGTTAKRKNKTKDADAMDSDADDEDEGPATNGNDDAEAKQDGDKLLSPEDARRQEELAGGVQKIKLKRQHSAEPLPNELASARKSPFLKTEDSTSASTPASTAATAGTPPEGRSPMPPSDPAETVGSPYKRHRASLPAGGLDGGILGAQGMSFGIGSHGGDNMFSSDTISGVVPNPPNATTDGQVKFEAGGNSQTHSVPPSAPPPTPQQQPAGGQQVRMEDEDEELPPKPKIFTREVVQQYAAQYAIDLAARRDEEREWQHRQNARIALMRHAVTGEVQRAGNFFLRERERAQRRERNRRRAVELGLQSTRPYPIPWERRRMPSEGWKTD